MSHGCSANAQVSIEGGTHPVWNPNGRELFFVSGLNSADRRTLMVAQFANGSLRGRPEPVFEFAPRELLIGGGWVRHYDVAKDGRGFYAMRVSRFHHYHRLRTSTWCRTGSRS